MKAICLSTDHGTLLKEVPTPKKAEPDHLIIKMEACGINPGDLAFIGGALRGISPESLYDICGVSGAGTVMETGDNVPEEYMGKRVAVYRSLRSTDALIQDDPDFKTQLERLSIELNTTAVFDGVGGALIGEVAKVLPHHSTIYTYGFLGGMEPMSVHTSLVLMKNLTIKGFGNFTTETVQNPEKLAKALKELREIIHLAHFKTKVGATFQLEDFKEALKYTSDDGSKAIIYPSEK